MGTARQSRARAEGREAVHALHAALAAVRQHPDKPELWRAAMRRAATALEAAAAQQPLTIQLRAGQVLADGAQVGTFAPDEPPFGLLRAAGVGALVLARGIEGEAVERLVVELAGVATADDPHAALSSLFATAPRDGVELRADVDHSLPAGEIGPDWSTLPAPRTTSTAVRALVERDASANLPALVARQVLDDAEQLGAAAPARLEALMARMLADEDVATVTWLIGEVQARESLAGCGASLAAMAATRCDEAWLRRRLEHGSRDELLALSALALELGDDVAERFATAAAETAHPLTQWLGALLHKPD